jgi:ABC-type branched-subunit amino acid transport system substrate-binding protein/tRNA A-37 threonylcarbamoyl transferase component Bud32
MTRARRLLLELGRGGAGAVYLALSEGASGFRKLKVVKYLHESLAAHPELLQSFLDEARLAAKLNHPNVVQTNEVGFEDGRYFIEMEYLEGQTLEAITKKGTLPLPLALFVVSEMLAGLDHAHDLVDVGGRALGIVHRDVSPHNVMVTYEGVVKILDFGIAKAVGIGEAEGVKGKVAYMAPEQAKGGAVDRRADLFAAGVILWQLVAGRRLWEGLDVRETLRRLDAGEIPRIADAPHGLAEICARAMARDPEDRYATARAMQAAVDGALAAAGGATRRELAAHLTARFAAQRSADKAAIDARILDDRPLERAGPPSSEPGRETTRTGELTATSTVAQGVASTPRPRTRSRRAPAIVAAALAIAALAAALSLRAPKRAPAAVSLASARCKVLADDETANDPRTLWIGAMFPLSGPDADAFGKESLNAAELARQDFVRIAKGIPARAVGRPPRKIGLLACDDAEDAPASARHLAEVARVPAVVGFYTSQEVIDLATGVFIPNGTLALATQNRSALVTGVPHPPGSPRLVWRTTTSMIATARPAAALVTQVLEPELHEKPLRVALFRARNVSGLSIADAFLAELRFNGKPAAENGGAYREFLFDDASDDYAEAAREIVAFAPHVLILPGVDGGAAKTLIAPIERAIKPRYVVTSYLLGDDFFAMAAKDPDLRRRVVGINPPSATPANRKLTVHYNEYFTPHVALSASPGAVYDAMYLVLYAAYALGDDPITGESLARAFGRISAKDAPPIDVGPANLFDAFARLARGEAIDLRGAATRLDFDRATGEPRADFALYCVGPREAVESGVVFRAATRAFEGLPLACP